MNNKYKDHIVFISGEWQGTYHRKPLFKQLAKYTDLNRLYIIEIPADIVHSLIFKPKRVLNAIHNFFSTVKYSNNIFGYRPLIFLHILFAARYPFLYKINNFLLKKSMARLFKRESINDGYIWIYRPEFAGVCDMFDGFKVIYDFYDEYAISSFDEVIPHIRELEGEILQKSDFVFTTASQLLYKAKKYNKNSHLILNAADIDNFIKAFTLDYNKPTELLHIKGPIIGYIGVFRDWIDFDLLEYLFNKHEKLTFLFVGNWTDKVDNVVARFKMYTNVIFTGRKRFDEIPAYLKYFDVAIIPNKINTFNQNVVPYKLYEYLAAGKKIVSTDTSSDIRVYGDLIKVAATIEEFSESITGFLSQNNFDAQKRSEFGCRQSWENRVGRIMQILGTGKTG